MFSHGILYSWDNLHKTVHYCQIEDLLQNIFCTNSPGDEHVERHQLCMPKYKAEISFICWGLASYIYLKSLNMGAVTKIPKRMITVAITIIFEEQTKNTGSASDEFCSCGNCYLHLCANSMLAKSLSSVLVCT